MKINFKQIGKSVVDFGKKHLPVITTTIGVGGMGATVVIVYKKSDEMHKRVEIVKANTEMTKLQKAWAYTKIFAMPAATFAASAGCIFTGLKVITNRNDKLLANNVALASAASLAQQELNQWKTETMEKVGDDTYNEIKNNVTHKKYDDFKEQSTNSELPKDIPANKEIFFEPVLGHEFVASKEEILGALVELNNRLFAYDTVSFTQWYNLLGIPTKLAGEAGDEHFFVSDDGRKPNLEINFDPDTTVDGRLCWLLCYSKDDIMLP